MNQILANEKIYVTPELKRKKTFFKLNFVVSIFLICAFSSVVAYSAYNRNKEEELSKKAMEDIRYLIPEVQDKTVVADKDVLVVYLYDIANENKSDEEKEAEKKENENKKNNKPLVLFDENMMKGPDYNTIALINIPKIGVNYPVLSKTTDAILKKSPTKFWGPDPNEVGNFCIIGHNYRNSRFFSKVPTLVTGDIIEIVDKTGVTVEYAVYDKFIVNPSDTRSTSQLTNGNREITLLTCTDDTKDRYIIKAREVK